MNRFPQAEHVYSTGKSRSRRGSALLLVLFTILLISGLIISAVEFVKHDVDEYAVLSHRFRAAQLAQSGVAFATNPQVKNEDRSLLNQRMKDGGEFKVSIASESTRLNINYILQNGREYLLQELFARWGVESKDSLAAISGLQEWVGVSARGDQSTNEVRSGNRSNAAPPANQGSPTSNNQTASQAAPNLARPFQAVEEMSLVETFAPVMSAQPSWANYFTVYGDGKIDVNLAEADTIALVTGIPPARATQFVKYRWGPDGIAHTQDDQEYKSLDQVRTALGMSPAQFALVQDLLSLQSAVDRIESTGIIAGYSRTITVITSRNSVPIRYLLWRES
jgi:general secretion pathway protein K